MTTQQWILIIKFELNNADNFYAAAQQAAIDNFSNEDYEAWWAGENGNEGYETENVAVFRHAANKLALDIGEREIDLQLWEQGNVIVKPY